MKIYIDGEGDIIIKRKKKEGKKEKAEDKVERIDKFTPLIPTITTNTLIFLRNIIDQMEIRVESVFRPNQEDVETAYALSGDDVIDMLHKFTSSDVIRDAKPHVIYTITEGKIRHILSERGRIPKIVVDVHTHPYGIAELSDVDKKTIKKVAEIFKEKMPGVRVYFGVHAVSEEKIGSRQDLKVIGNKIVWRSLTREHEVAFFDENGKPVDVVVR
jgi:hypothetical protein